MNTDVMSESVAQFQQAFDLCALKTRANIAKLAAEPSAWSNDATGDYSRWKEGFFEIGNWTSSFFTGMALLAWRETQDPRLMRDLERLAPWYHRKVHEHHMDTMHDLGFLYSLYSVGMHKLTGSREHRQVGLRAADVFAGRFMANGGYLQAWERMDRPNADCAGMAIIDCMMNLPLLYWASVETGNARYRDIAVSHANATMRHFVRADDSVYHAFRFDVATGRPLRPDNYCGRDVESHWARGTAWAIYGFALSHRYTGDERYLELSLRIARKFLQLLGNDGVPVWDFRLPAGEPPLRDSSAAAVAACGFQELLLVRPGDAQLSGAVSKLLNTLCDEAYFDSNPANGGVLRDGQVGDHSKYRAKNVYTSWGDYYLMEALSRQLGQGPTFW